VKIVQDICKKVVVHVSSQLRQPGIDGSVKAEWNSTRTDASIHCLSVVLIKPHHAGDVYNSLASMTALWTCLSK